MHAVTRMSWVPYAQAACLLSTLKRASKFQHKTKVWSTTQPILGPSWDWLMVTQTTVSYLPTATHLLWGSLRPQTVASRALGYFHSFLACEVLVLVATSSSTGTLQHTCQLPHIWQYFYSFLDWTVGMSLIVTHFADQPLIFKKNCHSFKWFWPHTFTLTISEVVNIVALGPLLL